MKGGREEGRKQANHFLEKCFYFTLFNLLVDWK